MKKRYIGIFSLVLVVAGLFGMFNAEETTAASECELGLIGGQFAYGGGTGTDSSQTVAANIADTACEASIDSYWDSLIDNCADYCVTLATTNEGDSCAGNLEVLWRDACVTITPCAENEPYWTCESGGGLEVPKTKDAEFECTCEEIIPV